MATMRGALARKKKVPAWLKQQDYLNAKLGREELVDRLHVRAGCCFCCALALLLLPPLLRLPAAAAGRRCRTCTAGRMRS